jgi:leucyl aminopeptidase (aminopeptidase T)
MRLLQHCCEHLPLYENLNKKAVSSTELLNSITSLQMKVPAGTDVNLQLNCSSNSWYIDVLVAP